MDTSMDVRLEHDGNEVSARATLEVVDQALADDVELATSRRLLIEPPLPDFLTEGTDVTITEVASGRVVSGIVQSPTHIELI